MIRELQANTPGYRSFCIRGLFFSGYSLFHRQPVGWTWMHVHLAAAAI